MPLKGAGYLRRLKTVPKAQYWQPHKEATSASCSPSWILPPALECTSVSFPRPHCRLSIRNILSPRSPFQTCSPVPGTCRRSSALTFPSSTPQTGLPLSSMVYSGTGVRDLRIPPPSIISTFLYRHKVRSISRTSAFTFPYSAFLRYFGINTIWYRHSISYVINCYRPFVNASFGFLVLAFDTATIIPLEAFAIFYTTAYFFSQLSWG